MPELVEQMYCSQQIVIPPKFPYILKRFCKAAIKTQPYDLLRWSYEYFRALAEHRPPPVKLRLEYPVYSTEGGLTRGCLKVLAQQLSPMSELPVSVVREAWQSFCLDPNEMRRILCLCEIYLRGPNGHTLPVPFLHFIAVAGGLLTKNLTHTMILLCECLTKEPDGGSAAIPVHDFLTMYKFLAKMDASKDVKYFNGYREGETPEELSVAEEQAGHDIVSIPDDDISDDYWQDSEGVQRLTLINAHVGRSTRLSVKLNMPITTISRSPSLERQKAKDWETYERERKGRPAPNEDVNKKLRELSSQKFSSQVLVNKEEPKKEEVRVDMLQEGVEIFVFDENGIMKPAEFFGEPKEILYDHVTGEIDADVEEDEEETQASANQTESDLCREFLAAFLKGKADRIEHVQTLLDEIAALVDRFLSANYDLGMVAGRQMSSTSGEFIVQHIEKEIMAYIDEQIAILPDPDLKKKKAKPEEVAMVRSLLESFIDDNMHIIVPEIEEIEEEEEPVPEVTIVYAVPGIGGPVDDETIKVVEEYALDVCRVQADLFMPRNIRHFMCPPLEKYQELDYNINNHLKEEIPAGPTFTD